MNMIQVENLSRDYGKNRGVFGLSFAVGEGEVFGFLGPNGAGKTTTIRHLMGFLRPRAGRCSILGQNCWQESAAVQKNLGYIPGEMAFPEGMTGNGFLQFYAHYRGIKTAGHHSRMQELLERFELAPHGKIKRMSKGMKQKLGIVAAFMHDPKVLILDEPTSGLDPLMQNRFIELVQEEKKRGKTILMSSHMFEEIERTCHRVGIIRQGRLVAQDAVDVLKAAQTRRYTVTLENENAAKQFAAEGLQVDSIDESRVTVQIKNNMQAFIAAMGKYPVANIAAPSQNLEEIFLQYYGGSGGKNA